MKVKLTSKQVILVIVIVCLNIYAISDGFIHHSFWGITFACGSVAALISCLQILKKIQELDSNEE